METQTKFDLNEAIRRWREGLETSPAIRPENLEELETHLRDSTGLLEAKGLSPEEAFWLARRRLGTSDVLEAEFGKVNGMDLWMQRILWIVTGCMVIGFLQSCVWVAASLLTFLGHQFSLRGHALGGFSTLAYLAAWFGVFLWAWQIGRRNHTIVHRTGQAMKRHPVWAALALCLLLLLQNFISVGTSLLTAKTMEPQSMGVLAQWRLFTSCGLSVLVWPMLLAWLLFRNNQAPLKPSVR